MDDLDEESIENTDDPLETLSKIKFANKRKSEMAKT